jgi:chemotaxis family two-component system response regulator Rcp1
LLVEANSGDVRLVKEALRDCSVPLNLIAAHDGEEALKLLLGSSPERPFVRPHVILLDLNLPKRSGHEVLHETIRDVCSFWFQRVTLPIA